MTTAASNSASQTLRRLAILGAASLSLLAAAMGALVVIEWLVIDRLSWVG